MAGLKVYRFVMFDGNENVSSKRYTTLDKIKSLSDGVPAQPLMSSEIEIDQSQLDLNGFYTPME